MPRLGELELADAAKEAAGNWQRFDSFVWFRKSDLTKPEMWTVIYTHHRDSGLLDQSNAAVISKAMLPFTEYCDPDVVFESHSHWAVGHVDGFSIRVFKRGRVTKAFRVYHELAVSMEGYPILDEADYSQRELEATLFNLKDASWSVRNDFQLPDGWESEVYDWLADNDPNELENRDDQGGYPTEMALRDCFRQLGYPHTV
jgi:hypothetical protein